MPLNIIASKTVVVNGAGEWYIMVWKSRQGTRGNRYDLFSFSANEKIEGGFGREIKGTGKVRDAIKAIRQQFSNSSK